MNCAPLMRLAQLLSRVDICIYLVGVARLKDVTGHLGLGVVGLAPQEIGKIGEIIAVVNETRDELCFVLEYEHGGVVAARGNASDEGGVEDQLNFSRLHHGAAVAFLTLPADLCHQPRQHGEGGPPVQRGPADVSQREPPVCLQGAALLVRLTLHVDFRPMLGDSFCATTLANDVDDVSFPANQGHAQMWLVCNSFSWTHPPWKFTQRGDYLRAQHVLSLSISCNTSRYENASKISPVAKFASVDFKEIYFYS